MHARRLLSGLCLSALGLAVGSPAFALANRVFVSQRSGNDANSCYNINTPCQTFAGAVLQLNPGGEAIVLDSGGYGPVTVTKSLTIEAPPGVLAFIHPPSGAGVTISAGASDTVILRGLTLNGGPSSGVGISVGTVGAVFIENCTVTGFGNGVEVDQGVKMLVKDSLFRANSQAGVYIIPNFIGTGTAYSTFDHCRFEYNGTFGLAQGDGSVTVVRDSVVSHNGPGGDGLDARTEKSGGTTTLTVTDCVVSFNGAGVLSYNLSGSGTPTVRIGGSTVSDNNSCGLRNISGTFDSLGNNLVAGNSPNTCGTITPVSGK